MIRPGVDEINGLLEFLYGPAGSRRDGKESLASRSHG